MSKLWGCIVAILLAGCANAPPAPAAAESPCAKHEASWDCQIERYGKVND